MLPHSFYFKLRGYSSMVEHLTFDQTVAGSNPVVLIGKLTSKELLYLSGLYCY